MPTVLILVLTLAALPLIFWAVSTNFSFGSTNVKGSAISAVPSLGFSVIVNSSLGTWDLVEYLCVSLSECTSSLTSGKRLGSVSGGGDGSHEVIVEATEDWSKYSYIKYYVKPGWLTPGLSYKVTDLGKIPGSQIHEITENGKIYQTVVSPVTPVLSAFYKSASFAEDKTPQQ
ncbi:MAG: hypothetical protein UX79_C0012G0007 [candidate division WWE3 bacterium GW2011_GWB1_47_11]|uniref:Uncharacterized protein n=2 Tax=Katanobacteria TaxID=422282 RepID=A0A0G1UI68_UNCKA|nr:MAG: hypothetical protein UX73_C0026G0008 [candidate division WWE3 bacterium GW2011_GWC1_47_10]KKU57405.1 MAG: hypothetical protein UX79_C0012G0007 [candidate division WWE3 bacterium GW2011_GWB1_47_11]